MSSVRKLQIKIEILRALNQVAPMVLLEESLKTQLQLIVAPTPMLSEIRESLNELESARMINGVRSEMADLIKWGITDSGRAKLAELVP